MFIGKKMNFTSGKNSFIYSFVSNIYGVTHKKGAETDEVKK
jgi:hypothetical protein